MRSDDVKRGVEKAPSRSLLRASGLTDADMEKPFIGVADSWNTVVPGHIHLDRITEAVVQGIEEAGGRAFVFGVPAVCDGIAMGHEGMRYSLVSRETIADSCEIMCQAHRFDGWVGVTNCDKVTPGMLMAAGRMDIPAAMVTGGAMEPGRMDGENLDLQSVFEAIGLYKAGKADEDYVRTIECAACPGQGSCSGLFTANTMACLTEVMGMSLTGCATCIATDPRKLEIAKATGKRIVELVKQNVNPRSIVTEASIRNAIRADMAIGGSTNTALHIPAIAREFGLRATLDMFDGISRQVPHITSLRPGGPYSIKDLDAAGGVPAVLNRLAGFLEDAPTINGKGISEIAEDGRVIDDEIIRPIDRPFHQQGGIAVLRGNIAPMGSVIKQSAVSPAMMRFTGKARVFDSEASGLRQQGDILRRNRPRRRCGDPLRRPQGSPGHAGDAVAHQHDHGDGSRRFRRPDHRRALLGGHPRRRHRPRVPRGIGDRADCCPEGWGHNRYRHPCPHAERPSLGRGDIRTSEDRIPFGEEGSRRRAQEVQGACHKRSGRCLPWMRIRTAGTGG